MRERSIIIITNSDDNKSALHLDIQYPILVHKLACVLPQISAWVSIIIVQCHEIIIIDYKLSSY